MRQPCAVHAVLCLLLCRPDCLKLYVLGVECIPCRRFSRRICATANQAAQLLVDMCMTFGLQQFQGPLSLHVTTETDE